MPADWRFRRALREPQTVQERKLRAYLERNARTAFGAAHDFDKLRRYEEFTRRVPLADYETMSPWVERVRRGESSVLTRAPATHLVPTSGSTGARKLIPFTLALQHEFNAAVAPWLADLTRQHPGILSGPAYWSITPAVSPAATETSVVPVGFSDDAAYLGGAKSWLVRAAMAAPNQLSRFIDPEEFRYATWLCLLRQRDLRLISVWHPSFLTLLLETLPRQWQRLLAEIHQTLKQRTRELEQADPGQPESLWPRLQVISCWGDAHAALALADLRRRFPRTHIQPKGLLATEACVTIPFRGAHPIALCSHFFEFLDEAGQPRLAHEVREGETYEVVVTTGGGLWRYRLGDLVRVSGRVGATPSLRFLGRKVGVSDRCGEKLSERFAAQVIQDATASLAVPPRFAMLAPDGLRGGLSYTLYLEGECQTELASRLDRLLCQNPQYAWCRDLGQLKPARVFQIARRGYETWVTHESSRGRRLGEIKASALSRDDGWSLRFQGQYRSGPV